MEDRVARLVAYPSTNCLDNGAAAEVARGQAQKNYKQSFIRAQLVLMTRIAKALAKSLQATVQHYFSHRRDRSHYFF